MIKRNNHKNNVSFTKLILITAIVGIALIISMKIYYQHSIQKPLSNNTNREEFVIEEGMSVNRILDKLEEKNFLNSKQKFVMKIYIKLNHLGTSIEAGTYLIPHNLNIKDLTQTIQNGKNKSIWVTIPSGLRLDEICQKIGQDVQGFDPNFSTSECINLTTSTNFIKQQSLPFNNPQITTLEGILFPDKYLVPINSSTTDILKILINNFKKNMPESFTYEDLIIASLLEKEGIDLEDKQIISGIIRKRIKEGWLIQIDATILYYKKDWQYIITQDDLKEDEPYNTYLNLGLPPTPICNVTKEDMTASIKPTNTKFYYYIHDNNHQPHYSQNSIEHQNNINKYLR